MRGNRALPSERIHEQLAVIGKVEEFFDAIDSNDMRHATPLMKQTPGDVSC